MKNLVIAAMLLSSTAAFADGFVCQSESESLTVKVFNHTQADLGTRNAAVMIISDSSIQYGNKTIAKFTDTTELLQNDGASYEANVDLRFTDSKRKGELIAGTKLGYVDTIALHVDFSYAAPVANGSHIEGMLTIAKRDGGQINVDMDCARYLKN